MDSAVVKKTGGGLYDPAAPYILFVANFIWRSRRMTRYYPYSLMPFDGTEMSQEGLQNFYSVLTPGHQVLIDSGVFTLVMNLAEKRGLESFNDIRVLPTSHFPHFDTYFDHYVKFLKVVEKDVWGYVELDIGDKQQKTATRLRMEAEGLIPIPVYHPFADGWDYFDELASQYDRICFANLSHTPAPARLRLLATLYERRQAYPHLWVHLLGMRNHQWLSSYPVNSSDVSSWMAGVTHGTFSCFVDGQAVGVLPSEYSPTGNIGSDNDHVRGTLLAAYQVAMDARARHARNAAERQVGLYA